jgi:hypothetical protein
MPSGTLPVIQKIFRVLDPFKLPSKFSKALFSNYLEAVQAGTFHPWVLDSHFFDPLFPETGTGLSACAFIWAIDA